MPRVKIDLPERFQFATEIPVRITDLNYGNHLGNDSLLSLVHEARVRFLGRFGFTEFNIGGAGIIMVDAQIVYKAEAFYGDILRIEVAAIDFQNLGCDLVYRISLGTTGKEIAHAKTGIVFFDYEKRKPVPMPQQFINALAKESP